MVSPFFRALTPTVPAKSFVIGSAINVHQDGDSITALAGSYARLFVGNKNVRYNVTNNGHSSSVLVGPTDPNFSVSLRGPTTDAICSGTTPSIHTVLIGHNDYSAFASSSQFLSDMAAYGTARKLAATKVGVCTILPGNVATVGGTSFASWRATVNTGLRAMVGTNYDFVVDFAADATVGTDAAGLNTTYYPDGTHPSATCSVILEAIYRGILNPLY